MRKRQDKRRGVVQGFDKIFNSLIALPGTSGKGLLYMLLLLLLFLSFSLLFVFCWFMDTIVMVNMYVCIILCDRIGIGKSTFMVNFPLSEVYEKYVGVYSPTDAALPPSPIVVPFTYNR